ncbi:unnamed protein product [Arctogadus glacialis]
MAVFSEGCTHWRLRPEASLPPLEAFTVCMHVQFQEKASSRWTAFMYHSAGGQRAELGLGGRREHLVVWMFGKKWTSASTVLLVGGLWYSFCLTGAQRSGRPTLYVDREVVALEPVVERAADLHPYCSGRAQEGTLTLGSSHCRSHGTLNPDGRLIGNLSLFRVWDRERTAQEVTSLCCTEGDLVRWEAGAWASPGCPERPESQLPCEWSKYEVRLRFRIGCDDGAVTDHYKARDAAHIWLRDVLASTIYINRVSVSQLNKSLSEDRSRKEWWAGDFSRFHCLAHLNVIPYRDVATFQRDILRLLRASYNKTGVQILADNGSIYTTPIEAFPGGTLPLPETNYSPSTTGTLKTTPSAPTSTPTSSTPPTTPSSQPFSPVATSSFSDDLTSTSTSPIPVTPLNALSELYFDVQANFSLEGVRNPEDFLHTWLKNTLPKDRMSVLNFKVLVKTLRDQENVSISERAISNGTSRESCVFQVRVMTSPSNPAEELLRQLLETPNSSMLQRDINISRIYIVKCEGVSHKTEKGLFRWPTTKAQSNATLPCPGNAQRNATRNCKLCLSTHWSAPDTNQCLLMVETIPDLDHIDVTPENSMDVVELIQRLLSDHSELTYPELMTVLNKLKSVLNVSLVTPELALALISIISEILESDSDLAPFTNLILEITAAVGDHLQGHSGSFSLEAPALALAVVDLPKGPFSSLSFGVSLGVLNPEIHINTVPFLGTVAFIALPSALNQSFPEPDPPSLTPPRVLFQFFGSQRLFKEPESTKRHQRLNTFVVAASVTNASRPITDLDRDVKIMLHHLVPNQLNRSVQCVYWDFNRNQGRGGWDSRGCRTHNTSVDYTTCLCDHLTHFGVLLDVSRTELDPHDEMVLTFITYVGCGVSSLFLAVTVLTYTAFEKLRRDYPSQILINLSLALLSLNVVFLLNSWLSSFGMYGLCVGVASTLHYFLLASFTWMGLEAVNMYLALVKVFNVYVPSYILKFCILGWGIPLVVCVLVLVLNRDAYSSNLYTDTRADVKMLSGFCWIQDDMTFHVTVVGYVGLVLLFNIAVFGVVLMQIRRMRANRPAGISGGLLRDLKGVASLTLLLGLTWTFGFLTWGPARVPLLYLFSALNSLQGLFIFIFHCLMRENVRRQWRMHLCGCLRLEDDSEWSHTVSVGAGRSNPIPPAPLDQSFHSVKSSASNSTSSTSASSEKSDPSTRRPHLALLVNGLAFPRAQAGCSHSEAHSPVAPDGPFASPPPP